MVYDLNLPGSEVRALRVIYYLNLPGSEVLVLHLGLLCRDGVSRCLIRPLSSNTQPGLPGSEILALRLGRLAAAPSYAVGAWVPPRTSGLIRHGSDPNRFRQNLGHIFDLGSWLDHPF